MIGEIDGEYRHDSRRNTLEWCLPVIDAKNKSGSLEFSIAGQPNDFFPVQVSFISKKNYGNVQITKVTQVDGNNPVRFSTKTVFLVGKYEILEYHKDRGALEKENFQINRKAKNNQRTFPNLQATRDTFFQTAICLSDCTSSVQGLLSPPYDFRVTETFFDREMTQT